MSPPLFASSWGGISVMIMIINFIAILSGQRAEQGKSLAHLAICQRQHLNSARAGKGKGNTFPVHMRRERPHNKVAGRGDGVCPVGDC